MSQREGDWSLAKRGNSQSAIRLMNNNDFSVSEPRLSTKRITHTKIVQSRKSDYSPYFGDNNSRKSKQGDGRRSTNLGRRSSRKSRSRSQSQIHPFNNGSSQQKPKVDANRVSHSRPHHQYYAHHHQRDYHDNHQHHHHHQNEPEPSPELLYLIPRAVIIQYGPYTFHGVTDFRVERLQGLQNVLEKMGANVKLVPNTDYRNRIMVWYMDAVIFCAKVTDMVHGGDGELDPLCIHAAYAFDHACRKSIHGLRNRVQLENENLEQLQSQSSVQADPNADEKKGDESSDDTEESEDTDGKAKKKKKSKEASEKKKSKEDKRNSKEEGEDKRNSKDGNDKRKKDKRSSKKTEDKRTSKEDQDKRGSKGDKRSSKRESEKISKGEEKKSSRGGGDGKGDEPQPPPNIKE